LISALIDYRQESVTEGKEGAYEGIKERQKMKKAPKEPGADGKVMHLLLYSETAESQGRSTDFILRPFSWLAMLILIDTAFKKGAARLK
jgi:hypothetical protein